MLLAAALVAFGYCGFVVLDGWYFQRQERRELDWVLSTGRPAVEMGALNGRLEVVRLGVSVMVVEGTSSTALRRAAGHISGTAYPGGPGNVGIAAHRDTYFRPLRNVRKDDVITLTTAAAEYRYRVVSTKVVEPDDTSVLDSSGDEVLTLVTCYPFYFIGSAPRRFIVRAQRIT